MIHLPLVSCLCISNGRPDKLRHAISYFLSQTYRNKELIIVSAQYDDAYKEIIDACNDGAIKYYGGQLTGSRSLGELRNYAIKRSAGEFFCVWDDDDWYHAERIELQVRAALTNKKQGSVLPYYILVNSRVGQAYMSMPIPPPASVLCRRNSLPEGLFYRNLAKEEDALLLNNLHEKNALFPLVNPALYIYHYHGSNTSNWEHIKKFCGAKFSSKATGLIVDIVSHKYNCEQGSAMLYNTGVLGEFDYFNTFAAHSSL